MIENCSVGYMVCAEKAIVSARECARRRSGSGSEVRELERWQAALTD